MSSPNIRASVTLAALICAGCVASPPPPPVMPMTMIAPPPQAVAAPQAQAAQAGQTCREYQQTITLNGQPQEAWGTTCLQPDGTWKVVSQPSDAAPAASSSVAPPPPPPPVQQQAIAVQSYPAYAYYPYPSYYYYQPPTYYSGGPMGGGRVFVRSRWH